MFSVSCLIDIDTLLIHTYAQVPQHSELCWILSCLTPFQPLQRMTQFKVCLNLQEREKERESVCKRRAVVYQGVVHQHISNNHNIYTEQGEARRCCSKGC